MSAFFLSGTRPPPLELDPSWHAALEYATVHHLQFGTQIVFTFGPLGFLSTRTSMGHLLGARIAFAFFWSALVALSGDGAGKAFAGMGPLRVSRLVGGLHSFRRGWTKPPSS